MTILKLQDEGDSFTGTVKGCQEVAGNFGPQVQFDFASGETLYLPKDSADRQLGRINLGYVECVGETLTFSRDPNKKVGAKPYWGIRVADAVDRSQPAAPKRLPPPDKYIPGIDGPEGPPEEDSPYEDSFPPHQANTRVPEPKPTPRELSDATARKAQVARAYLDLLGWVRTQEPTKGMDDQAQQAAAATIWIHWKSAGLTP